MKNNSKRPATAGNKTKGVNRSFAKPPRECGALNFQKTKNEAEKIDISKIIKSYGTSSTGAKGLPELLAPAGSLEALKAAIAGGADAVYFGGGDFNARINAKNFTNEELKQAIDLLHSCGKKAYITLNTLVHDREIEDYLRFAEFVYLAGADALIVADIGGAQAIHRHLPHLELHASTQMSGHNLAQAQLLADNGFSRMVVARETSRANLEYLVKNSPIEIEMFTHGALCVCHSGQCLFSSLVGGRSGNRGECAQPCRLPYRDENGNESYPLSLKDLSLASHITELIDMGVHSLKIEGRMKSPEYVFGVVRAFRTLLDEGRNATPGEISELAKIFSRGGFTQGYYENKIDGRMLGIRSDEQKRISRLSLYSSERMDEPKPKKIKISAYASVLADKPISLSLECGDVRVTAHGQIPEKAISTPLSAENIKKSLTKLGATRFELCDYVAVTDDDIIVPVSALNALRRDACELLEKALRENESARVGFEKYEPKNPEVCHNVPQRAKISQFSAKMSKNEQKTARFYSPEQITDDAKNFFDIIYLPLEKFSGECEGVVLPPVIFDSEMPKVEKMLESAKKNGAKYALVGNLGALKLAKRHGFDLHGDFRFNVYNNETVAALSDLAIGSIILSPELTLPQIRDISGDTAAIVYGRIPLMLLEKCVAKEVSSCDTCASGRATLTDRKGISFPVLREWEHRSVIYNSAPTYMADRRAELDRAGVKNCHFIFSTESKNEVNEIISAYKNGKSAQKDEKIRRI